MPAMRLSLLATILRTQPAWRTSPPYAARTVPHSLCPSATSSLTFGPNANYAKNTPVALAASTVIPYTGNLSQTLLNTTGEGAS